MNNKYRYFITDQLLTNEEFFPSGEDDLQEEWQPYDDYIEDRKRVIKNKIQFRAAEFDHFYTLETSNFRCDPITIVIQKKCDGVWSDWYTGQLILSRAEWNWEQCIVSFDIEPIDPYECYNNKKEEDVDLFNLNFVGDRVTAKLLPPNTTLEYVEYTNNVIRTPFQYWGGGGIPADGGWVLWKHTYQDNGTTWQNKTYWVRERRVEPCANPALLSPWILIANSCPGAGKIYARPASIFSCQITQESNISGMLITYMKVCKVVGVVSNESITEIDNGLLWRNVLTALAAQCSLTVKSDFFQINPDNASANNYVTGAITKTANLILYQKSDVKRPKDLNNASRMVTRWSDLMEAMCLFFNLTWRISGGILQIEHVSYWTKSAGIDTTDSKFARYMNRKHRYSYDSEKLPRLETWKNTEATIGSDFEPNFISYSSKCANQGKDGLVTYETQNMTTDLLLCLNNPANDSNLVEDAGIFVMATEEFLGNYHILTEAAVRYEQAPNNTLGWSQLLRDYHRYRRPFLNGRLNNRDVTFNSVKPTKKGEPFSIPLCCGDVFNPDDIIKTKLGDGTVELATYSLKTGMLQLSLLYNAESDLDINNPPVANPDAATTFKNIPVTIDVLANDSDADGIGTIIEVEIFTAPTTGTAEVLPDKRIKYTPGTNALGSFAFYYRIKDDTLQWSNIALVNVTVIDPTPDAVNDFFNAVKNVTQTIPSVLTNDFKGNGASSLTIITPVVVTSQGVTITFNPDGSFSYAAPNAVVTDSFSYTVQNDLGYQDTATVSINVVNPPTPNLFVFAKSVLSKAEACSRWANPAYRTNYYSPDSTLAVGSVLYSDNGFVATAYYGYYSNGTNVYFINANDGVIDQILSC